MFQPLVDQLNATIADFSSSDLVAILQSVQIGIEREGLRVNHDGHLNQQRHDVSLGAAMTHPLITTDFSENLLEIVTQPQATPLKALQQLDEITHFVLQTLPNQYLWPASMPPQIYDEADIPIAQYGDSNQGKMKHLYRRGLSVRYGRMMQAIAGIHFNFSLQHAAILKWQQHLNNQQRLEAFRSDRYLNLVRNVTRFGFVIPYLFGASPVLSKCFFQGRSHKFMALNQEDVYLPYATSLRLSDIGYSNKKCHFAVSTNTLASYINDLNKAVTTPCKDFDAFNYPVMQQLNNHILQIENEYYTAIRPKQVLEAEERPLCALKARGILYVELRSLDVDPFVATGISLETMKFIQAFLSMCLLVDAPEMDQDAAAVCANNLKKTAEQGRDPDMTVQLFSEEIQLTQAIDQILTLMIPICALLGEDYNQVLVLAQEKVRNPELTPSAQILAQMRAQNLSYQALTLQQAKQHAHGYQSVTMDAARFVHYQELAKQSLLRQAAIEQENQIDFEEYLQRYLQKVCA